MMYLLLKVAHVAAMIVWIGGLLMQAFLLRTSALHMAERSVIVSAQRWDRQLTVPAMLLAWSCGLALAGMGNWLAAPWLGVKLALVVILSALHGVQGGSLRRMADGQGRGPAPLLRHSLVILLGCMAGIVLLVVVKPR